MKPALLIESLEKKKIIVWVETVNTKLEHHPACTVAKFEINLPEDTVRAFLSFEFAE
jgi:hypothetical protein